MSRAYTGVCTELQLFGYFGNCAVEAMMWSPALWLAATEMLEPL
jgi:hypothetical protein